MEFFAEHRMGDGSDSAMRATRRMAISLRIVVAESFVIREAL